jgi:4-hydroxy-tetrahydrodipicolinate reductase
MARSSDVRLAIIGYGKMGREIERAAQAKGLTVAAVFDINNNVDGAGLTPGTLKDVDVCIDFSAPSAVMANIEAVAGCKKNIVVGTTGWYDQLDRVKALVREKKIGLLYSSNFSLGVNIFLQIVSQAAHLFDKYPDYDVALSELHHRGKADSPSGTALALGAAVTQAMKRKSEIFSETSHGPITPHHLHVTSTRVGSVTGTHRVLFDAEADAIELVHTAKNRSGFVQGAIVAAEWLKGKRGLYTMRDVISL